jgi:Tol biopolymer transport system component
LSTRNATGTLAIVDSSGGAPRPLADEFASARYGVWSPDGDKVLFLGDLTSDAGASLDWYVVSVAGGHPVRTGALEALRAARLDGAPIPAAWTADGVAFTTTDATTSNVWRLPVSPDSGRVAGSPTRLTFGSALERTASVSAMGQIAFTSLVENVDVWRVPLDPGTGMTNGRPERVTDDAASDRTMNVSGNGRTLAFVSSRTGRDEVWLKDLATGAERQLTFVGSRAGSVAPDGLRVAVHRIVGDHSAIDAYDSSGSGEPVRLCDDCAGGAWSADGSRLLITRRRHSLDRSVILDLASKHEVEIASHAAWNIFQSRLSPDGRWVVFHTTNAPNLRQVHVVRASPEAPASEWVAVAPDFGIFPEWSPDGTGVYYFSLRDGYMCAWLQRMESATSRPAGAPEAVLHLHQPRLRAAVRATPSNDVANGAMYVTLTETTGNIWMLEPTVGR